ncbi:hypothetical protein EDC94DRAFT_692333 [Helicostylum pulchrum]|nr:hypothetical protein EDC94DRAFT_692333 [Helicostylum pulchrum]
MKSLITLLFILSTIIYVSALKPSLNQDLHTPNSNNVPYMQEKPNFLIKRESRRYIRRSSKNCAKKMCSLNLKPCPKDCPQSCGYIDSPDPCCPLLGTPSCPDL